LRKEKRAGKGKKNEDKEEAVVYSLGSYLTCSAILSTVEQWGFIGNMQSFTNLRIRGNHSVDAHTAKQFWSQLHLAFWSILSFASEYFRLYMQIFK